MRHGGLRWLAAQLLACTPVGCPLCSRPAGCPSQCCSLAPSSPACSLVDQLTSQHAEELGIVQCGQTFSLEVEALDAFSNRWVDVVRTRGRSETGGCLHQESNRLGFMCKAQRLPLPAMPAGALAAAARCRSQLSCWRPRGRCSTTRAIGSRAGCRRVANRSTLCAWWSLGTQGEHSRRMGGREYSTRQLDVRVCTESLHVFLFLLRFSPCCLQSPPSPCPPLQPREHHRAGCRRRGRRAGAGRGHPQGAPWVQVWCRSSAGFPMPAVQQPLLTCCPSHACLYPVYNHTLRCVPHSACLPVAGGAAGGAACTAGGGGPCHTGVRHQGHAAAAARARV